MYFYVAVLTQELDDLVRKAITDLSFLYFIFFFLCCE